MRPYPLADHTYTAFGEPYFYQGESNGLYHIKVTNRQFRRTLSLPQWSTFIVHLACVIHTDIRNVLYPLSYPRAIYKYFLDATIPVIYEGQSGNYYIWLREDTGERVYKDIANPGSITFRSITFPPL